MKSNLIKNRLIIYSKTLDSISILERMHKYYVYGILQRDTLNYLCTTLNVKPATLRHLPDALEIETHKTTQFVLRDLKNIFKDEVTVIRLESYLNEIPVNYQTIEHENKQNE